MQFSDVKSFLHPSASNDTLYVVNFWATWCKPCVEELPAFRNAASETAGKKIRFIFISLDSEKNWDTLLKPFLVKNNMTETIWVMYNQKPVDWIDQVTPEWQGSIPATLFINASKNIYSFHETQFPADTLKNTIEQFQSQ